MSANCKLVEQLRSCRVYESLGQITTEAADEIERLRAEVEQLRSQLKIAEGNVGRLSSHVSELEDEAGEDRS
jgi:predicted nuclease with TOPRIM domain